jgi:hypothetical protein
MLNSNGGLDEPEGIARRPSLGGNDEAFMLNEEAKSISKTA